MSATIVLVHGAWADASSFAPITEALQKAGHTVLNVPNQLRALASDAAYVAATINQVTSGPVVLVGHSYGGAVISEAAVSTPTVKALVYVNAYIPDVGESALDLTGAKPGSLLGADPQTIFNLVSYPGAPQGDYDTTIKPEKFKEIFAGNLSDTQAAVLAASQRPAGLGALGSKATAAAWKDISSWVFIGTDDQAIPPAEQRVMAARANAIVVEAAAPHLSMLAQPEAITDLILSAASTLE